METFDKRQHDLRALIVCAVVGLLAGLRLATVARAHPLPSPVAPAETASPALRGRVQRRVPAVAGS